MWGIVIVAIVLGSGGSRGNFQVGALQFLYSRGIRPDTICGTSIGAINGLVLAEGGIEKLLAIWLDFRDNRDMYLEEPWLRAIKPITGQPSRMTPPDIISTAADRMVKYTLFPTMLLADTANFWISLTELYSSGRIWQLKSYLNPSPFAAKLRALFDPGRVNRSGIRLRIATVSLESGELRYITETGHFTDGTAADQPLDMIDAVLASSAIPGIFPPIRLHAENYIDGGVREMLPVQAAINLGEDRIYAIACSKSGVDRARSFDNSSLVDISIRAMRDIMFDEIQRNETNPPRGWGADITLIQPTLNIHDVLMVDPGLISIGIAYGYMRAFDAVEGDGNTWKSLTLRRLSDGITRARINIWRMEHVANGKPMPGERVSIMGHTPSPDHLRHIRRLKRDLKALVDERRQFGDDAVPGDAEAWWMQWERHKWTPLIPTPWAGAVKEELP